MTIQYFIRKIQDVELTDFFSAAKLLAAFALKPLFPKHKGCWVVCERPKEARDNGYHFFKHVREKHPEIECYYAIDRKSPDVGKILALGNVVQYGSLKHWILYLCAEYNISSQKGGKPNAAVCAFLELTKLINSKLVFLQHGVTINNNTWAQANTTQLEYFITSTIPETEYIQKTFGFPEEKIVLTGMPRFDNLHNNTVDEKYVLIMPTWRGRFILKSEHQKNDSVFSHSLYKRAWEDLLNSPGIRRLIEEYHLRIVFFPHKNMQKYLEAFSITNDRVVVADWKDYDIQSELKKAAVMITDYSSVFFDMVYMKKPVIFYQFDYEEFRQYDYKEGYFDYKNNPFGKWCQTGDDVVSELTRLLEQEMRVSDEYIEEHKQIFPFWDENNSERIVKMLGK